MDDPSVAIYWDFENIHASVYDTINGKSAYKSGHKYSVQEPLVDVQKVFDYAASFGNIVINKAYCNWQWLSRYRDVLLQNSIELIQLFPPGSSAKNGADIKMALDAVDDVNKFDHITYLVIVGGDSDFIPLAQKAKAAGKTVIGVGCKDATNRYWANSCSEFKYYESLESLESLEENDKDEDSSDEVAPDKIIKQAIRQLSKMHGDPWVLKAAIRPMIKRLHPTFDETLYGASSFAELLNRYETEFEIRRGENDQEVAIRKS